jgi:hypothetical protein
MIITTIFFLPYISDNLPPIGTITAAEIRYAVSIQEDVLYDILKSLIISGIAGKSIVSPYIVTKSAEPNTMRVIHAETGIFTDVVDVLLPLLLPGEEGDGDDEDGSANISDPEILIFLIKCFCLTTYEY